MTLIDPENGMSTLEFALRKALDDFEMFEIIFLSESTDDEAAHDEISQSNRRTLALSWFDRALEYVTSNLGKPDLIDSDEDTIIPVCGVIGSAIWTAERKAVFLVVAQEDRECPVIVAIGSAFPTRSN